MTLSFDNSLGTPPLAEAIDRHPLIHPQLPSAERQSGLITLLADLQQFQNLL